MKLTTILIDDEKLSRDVLRSYVNKYCPSVTILDEASNIQDGLAAIEKHQPDFIFLDVEMPFGNAFDLLEQLPNREFETIFVTAYNQYAIEAIQQHAAYYLMKPVDIDQLITAVQYVEAIKTKELALAQQILKPKQFTTEKITIPTQDGFEVIQASSIYFCKADDNYTEIYFEQKKLLVSKTLKYFETLLEPLGFVRTHKSYLVNVSKIVKYVKGKGGSVVLENGKEIMVSSSKKNDVLSYFE